MYRRVCLITHFKQEDGSVNFLLQGLCGVFHFETEEAADDIADAWLAMPGPRKRVRKNGRFYFTEKGWNLYGRRVIAACQRHNAVYRVLAVEEHDVDVIYQDEVQVVVRPKRKKM